jgi:hypothetical protein
VSVVVPLTSVAPKLDDTTLTAFELLQVNVVDPPFSIEEGDAERLIDGLTGSATLTLTDLVSEPTEFFAVIRNVLEEV